MLLLHRSPAPCWLCASSKGKVIINTFCFSLLPVEEETLELLDLGHLKLGREKSYCVIQLPIS